MRIIAGERGRKLMRMGALALVCALPLPAAAQPPWVSRSPGPQPRPILVGGNVGMGSAVGSVGVTVGYMATEQLELEFGVGRGYSGAQVEVMPRLLLGYGFLRLVLGLGPSLSMSPDGRQGWVNGEIGPMLVGRRLFASLTGGFTYLVAGRVPAPCFLCDTTPTDRRYYDAPTTFPTTRLTIGLRF
jgi:hypothetical protein